MARTDGGRFRGWVDANLVPLVLIPLAAILVWVAVWKVWLPRPGTGGAVGKTTTSVDANAGTRPTHKVTRVVKTTVAAAPSRRSETLAIVLLFLGAGAAVIAVFHDRITGIELDRTGIKLDLTKAEQAGAAALVGRLAGSGAGPHTYARALARYVSAVASRRADTHETGTHQTGTVLGAAPPGLSADQAVSLAERIADAYI